MRNYQTILLLSVITIICFACSAEATQVEAENETMTALPDTKSKVSVMTLKKQIFNHELVSNGKMVAKGQADLRFESGEILAHIYVKNGDRVRKGEKLAELDKFKLTNKSDQAKYALERARLDLQDVLIGQGYTGMDLEKVPSDIMALAKVKSGYDQALAQYNLAKREEERATLVAPFDGVVANLFAKPANVASTSEVFCSIIDTQGMEVDFSVLESELPFLQKGNKVAVIPYADSQSSYNGKVSEINPLVDDKGVVKVRAQIDGKGKLFTGMNVRVLVKRSLGMQLVIPKSAVVFRSGKKVVFTLEEGKAKWNYVQTGLENTDSCVVSNKADIGITDGLSVGDVVIVSDNVNLAHEALVQVGK